jgi:hypothetical protein
MTTHADAHHDFFLRASVLVYGDLWDNYQIYTALSLKERKACTPSTHDADQPTYEYLKKIRRHAGAHDKFVLQQIVCDWQKTTLG